MWSDLTNLIGGEDFWIEAEEALRTRAAKVVFVLSEISNSKQGPLQELHLAKEVAKASGLMDFVIPAHLAGLPYRDINIELTRVNAIPFEHGWAGGFAQLLRKLRADNVPRFATATATAFTEWWRTNNSASQGVVRQPEVLLSNWFPVEGLPLGLYFHSIQHTLNESIILDSLESPAFFHNGVLVSFASSNEIRPQLPAGCALLESRVHPISGSGGPSSLPDRRQTRNFVVRLLRNAWDRALVRASVPRYVFADGGDSFFFPKGLVDKDTVHFVRPDGSSGYRQVVGRHLKATWHFALDAKPLLHPLPALAVKAHVLFSDDGESIWSSKARLHSRRRRFCRNWWNAEWRDRVLASMSWLEKNDGLRLILSADAEVRVSAQPVQFSSPLSYATPGDPIPWDEDDYDDEDEGGSESQGADEPIGALA